MKYKQAKLGHGNIDWREAKFFRPEGAKKTQRRDLLKLCESLCVSEIKTPVFVWRRTGEVLDGRTRIEAMRLMDSDPQAVLAHFAKSPNTEARGIASFELPDKIPAVFVDLETEEQAIEFVAVCESNYGSIQSAFFREWAGPQAPDFDYRLSLPKMLFTKDPPDRNSIIETGLKSIVKYGDVWEIGKHVLRCENVLNAGPLPEKAALCVTSPPYWIGKEYEEEKTIPEVVDFIKKVSMFISENIDVNGRIVINTGTTSSRFLKEKIFYSVRLDHIWIDELKENGWRERHTRIWIKAGSLGGGHISAQTDIIAAGPEYLITFYNPRGKSRGQNKISEDWAQQPVFQFQGEAGINQAAYPVELPWRFIKLYAREGETVLEPFAGTGTTMEAAEDLGVRCVAFEKMPSMCDYIIERMKPLKAKKIK